MAASAGYWSAPAVWAEQTEIVRRRSQLIAENEQWLVNSEVQATRGALLQLARQRTNLRSLGFLDAEFLLAADRPTVYRAIVNAAVGMGGAAGADLQIFDPETGSLRIVDQRGFSRQFLTFFAKVDRATPSACGAALTSKRPVVVDRVNRSGIFVGQPTLEVLMDAGSRAVASYPLLRPNGQLTGVLSFHYPRPPAERPIAAVIAHSAAAALSVLA